MSEMKTMNKISLLLSGLALAGFSGCTSAKKAPVVTSEDIPSTGAAAQPVTPAGPALTVSPAAGATALIAQPITSSGENSDPRYSPDGTRLLFISRSRPTHRQGQVYEIHLGMMKEKRVTFHDGDDFGPVYLPDGLRFIFASSTDEIKEEPFVTDRMMKSFNPDAYSKRTKERGPGLGYEEGTEIYEQSLNGRAIERLSKSPGFDSDVDPDPKGKRLVFSSSRGDKTSHLFFLKGKVATQLTKGAFFDRWPRFSPDGKFLVWSRQIVDSKDDHMDLMIAEAPAFTHHRVLFTGASMNLQPSWHPDGDTIVFSSNLDDSDGQPDYFDLYTIDKKGTCLKRLTDLDYDLLQPAFRPDGKQLAFTVRKSGRQQIYAMDYRPPSECMGAKPAASPTPAK